MIHVDLESSLQSTCPLCGKDHNAKFFSHFVDRKHYVVGNCQNCGYRIEFEDNDLGSGLFMPGGDTTAVTKTFRKENVEHMKTRAEGNTEKTFVTMRFRFLDNEPITEERKR